MSPKPATPSPAPRSVVKGPIKCHRCQLLCATAEQYLDHIFHCGKTAQA